MLQQTRVDTVIPYFHRFIEHFPTIQALADAPEDDVLKCWEGLGYYSRARNLQAAARQVTELYEGVMPSGKEEVSGLKGIGPYTSGAIRSIAFNIPAAAVDGNVMRVLSRFFLIEEDIMKVKTRTKMEDLVLTLVPEGRASDFTQGLMELGALICTPKSPKCLVCPVMEHCSARLEGKEESLPIKTKAKPPRREDRLTAIVEGTGVHAGKILIRKRPSTGLLAGMWELPHVLVDSGEVPPGSLSESEAMNHLSEALLIEGVPVTPNSYVMNTEHIFSHIHWHMGVYRCTWQDAPITGLQAAESAAAYETGIEHFRWIEVEDMERYAFPNVFIRILNAYFSL